MEWVELIISEIDEIPAVFVSSVYVSPNKDAFTVSVQLGRNWSKELQHQIQLIVDRHREPGMQYSIELKAPHGVAFDELSGKTFNY